MRGSQHDTVCLPVLAGYLMARLNPDPAAVAGGGVQLATTHDTPTLYA